MPDTINPNLSRAPSKRPSAQQLFADLTGASHRRALGKAISLLESTQPEDQPVAEELIDLARSRVQSRDTPTLRLGVSGTPGVGKSTFVENFGLAVTAAGYRLAVLAIDPTSSLSGGSILGDKTRMQELSRHPRAYIRPSPSAGHLGGTTAATRGAILLCEAAGYDFIIVETVGVGQAEWRVHGMTDAFLLLAQPAAGDDLQSIKRGILELADHIVVNKADALPAAAKQTARELRQGLHLAPPRPDGWTVKVDTISALQHEGLDRTLERLRSFHQQNLASGGLARKRAVQETEWLRENLQQTVAADLARYLADRARTSDELRRIIDEQVTLSAATRVLLAEFYQTKP